MISGLWDFILKDIKATLKNFGSNIIFANGLLDPWSGSRWPLIQPVLWLVLLKIHYLNLIFVCDICRSVLQNISETIVALNTEEGNALTDHIFCS